MGACFVDIQVPGEKTRNEVKAIFEDAQETDRYENGHSYSGGIGMANGITFPDKTFESTDAAYEWLAENAQKWEAALCVIVKDGDKVSWLIGAWCSS